MKIGHLPLPHFALPWPNTETHPALCADGFTRPSSARALLDERRAVREMAALMRDPVFRGTGAPAGDGRPVMLIPGFGTGDISMTLLSRWLARNGWATVPSRVHLNIGCARQTMDHLVRRAELVALSHGAPVTLIGHSLGGVFAKAVAVRRPEVVSAVVTLGSPLLAPTAAHRILLADVAMLTALSRFGVGRLGARRIGTGRPGSNSLMASDCVRGECAHAAWQELHAPFPTRVAFTSVYSRSDGLIDWHACLDPAAEAVEVESSHCGMAVNAAVYRALAVRLGAAA
ncbi:MAG TPA: alpha/beta fold hydrolase [Sporichthyaceae bacterium]|nr:alpha/beta fold hydrolase [Sporichthyaceae bacterium]